MMNNCNDIKNPEKEEDLPKLPFRRLKYALTQVVNVAIPLHVALLKQQNENIVLLKKENKELELRSEQVKATKTVQLLKADLFELEKLNIQVRDEDDELFHSCIKNSTKDAVEILSIFMDLHSDIFSPLPEIESDLASSTNEVPPLICNYNDKNYDTEETVASQVQEVADLEQKQVYAAKKKFDSLNFLHKELLEVHSLIQQFAKFVFRQKESVDTIQANIEQTNENVFVGTEYLKKASDYKAATFPIAGAVIGGLILGPAGALAGFKIFGSIACVAGGSLIGYGAGMKLKKKKQECNEFEMKTLTYPAKSQSRSTPDLSLDDSNKKST